MKQWAVPVLVGLATAAAILAWDPLAPADVHVGPDPAPGPLHAARTPFSDVSPPARLVFVSDKGDLPPHGSGLAGPGLAYTFRNATPSIAIAELHAVDVACQGPCGIGLTSKQPAPVPGPRLMAEGHSMAELAVFVFDEAGSLLATDQDDHPFDPPSYRLPKAAWYFGNDSAPVGTIEAATVAGGILRDHVHQFKGAQAGDIVSARLDDHPYAGLIGPVYVTVRIEAVR